MVSLDPGRLDEVIDCVGTVGSATGTGEAAEALMDRPAPPGGGGAPAGGGTVRPHVLVLEWPEPPFNGGHWVPDMVEAAGGVPVLAAPGDR